MDCDWLPTAFEPAGKPAPSMVMTAFVSFGSAGHAVEASKRMLGVWVFPVAGVTAKVPIGAADAGTAARVLRPTTVTRTARPAPRPRASLLFNTLGLAFVSVSLRLRIRWSMRTDHGVRSAVLPQLAFSRNPKRRMMVLAAAWHISAFGPTKTVLVGAVPSADVGMTL